MSNLLVLSLVIALYLLSLVIFSRLLNGVCENAYVNQFCMHSGRKLGHLHVKSKDLSRDISFKKLV